MNKIKVTHGTAGILLFLGALQWIIITAVSRELAKGSFSYLHDFSVNISAISSYVPSILLSDLLSSVATLLFGIILIIAAFIIHHTYRFTSFTILLILSGTVLFWLGMHIGVIQSADTYEWTVWILVTSLCAVSGYLLVKKPVSYCSLFIGIFSLIIMHAGIIGNYSPLHLRPGAASQIAQYILVIWVLVLGGYFMGYPETFTIKRRR